MSGPMLPPARSQLLRQGVRAPRPQLDQGIIHALHSVQLRVACATPASSAGGVCPTVVFTGDSTSLLSGNQAFNEMETISGLIQRRLRQQNPGVTTWNFIDRGIGGTTWSHLGGTPPAGSLFPSWYTTTTQPWVNTYISPVSATVPDANAPDLVVICMGTNDLNAVAFSSIRTAINLFANTANFPVTPDIWLCTTTGRIAQLGPSTQVQIDGQWLAGAASRFLSWTGPAMLNSTYPRSIGLLDFQRQDALCRLGYDPCRQVLEEVLTDSVGHAVGTTRYVLPECDGDLDLQVTFPGQAATIFNNSGNVRIVVGAPTNGGTSESYVSLSKNSALIASQYVSGGGLTSTLTNSTLGSGDLVARVIAQQNQLTVFSQGTRIFDGPVMRGHGRFTPSIYFSIEPPPTTVDTDFYRAGRRLQYAPTILEAQAWDRDGTARYGGGSVNHPSSWHMAETVRAVLDAQNFCVAA